MDGVVADWGARYVTRAFSFGAVRRKDPEK